MAMVKVINAAIGDIVDATRMLQIKNAGVAHPISIQFQIHMNNKRMALEGTLAIKLNIH
jgi:hypothetical protein